MLIHNADITGSLIINGIPFNSGSFSGSFQGDGSQLSGVTGATTASYVEYSNVGNKPTLVSGSSQITYSGLSGIPAGIVSGSSQVSFNGIVDKPTLVSGSSQVTYGGLLGIPVGIVSGSSQVSFNGIVDKPTLVSGSAQINYPDLSNIPNGIVSSSTQITGYNIFATTGSNTFNGAQTITGSIFGTGSLTIDGCITATGQIIAQTINVQQVTSSIVYSCGSNIFGTSISNTQQFTGSMLATGSLTLAGPMVGSSTACFGGNVTTSGCVGIGTPTAATPLHIVTAGLPTIRLTLGSEARCHNINGVNLGRDLQVLPFRHFSVQTGNGIAEGQIVLNAYEDFIVGTGASYTSRLTITPTGIACFACQVCAPAAIFSGCVGIGITTPSYDLTLSKSVAAGNVILNIENTSTTGAARLWFGNNVSSTGARIQYFGATHAARPNLFSIGTDGANDMMFETTGTERARITSTGIACFACQVCAKSLYFSSNSTGQITFGSNDACNPYIVSDSSNNLYFGNNNSYKILVPQDGSDMVFRTSPTYANPQTRLTITAAGIACFACQVCAPSAIFSGNVTISGGNDLVFRDASNYISSPATDTLRIVTANSERVRITSTGIACFACQVCAPCVLTNSTILGSVNGPANNILRIYRGGGASNYSEITNIGGTTYVRANGITGVAASLELQTKQDDWADFCSRLTIVGNGIACFACQVCAPAAIFTGCVGIGVTTSSAPLTIQSNSGGVGVHIVGRSADGFGFLTFRNNANNTVNGEIGISDAQNMLFYTGATPKLTIASTGVACFACTVCAPLGIFSAAPNAVNARLNGFGTGTIAAGASCLMFTDAVINPGLYLISIISNIDSSFGFSGFLHSSSSTVSLVSTIRQSCVSLSFSGRNICVTNQFTGEAGSMIVSLTYIA
jgi:hypothetical protein